MQEFYEFYLLADTTEGKLEQGSVSRSEHIPALTTDLLILPTETEFRICHPQSSPLPRPPFVHFYTHSLYVRPRRWFRRTRYRQNSI